MKFSEKEIFLFDAFGTLFKTGDTGGALREIAGDKTDRFMQTWRRKQLEYTWLRNSMRRYVPFSQVTREALDYSMRLHGLEDGRIPGILLPVYEHPSLIPGAGALLERLKSAGKTVCILSNGTREMLKNGVERTGISDRVDHIFSVDEIGIFKPDPAVYRMAVDALGRPLGNLLFFSSNQWDVSGASVFGLDCVWVNRTGEVREVLPFGKVEEVSSLDQV